MLHISLAVEIRITAHQSELRIHIIHELSCNFVLYLSPVELGDNNVIRFQQDIPLLVIELNNRADIATEENILPIRNAPSLLTDFPSTLSVCLWLRTRSSLSAQAREFAARYLSTRLTC